VRFYAIQRSKASPLDAGGRAGWFVARSSSQRVAQVRRRSTRGASPLSVVDRSACKRARGNRLLALTLIRPGQKRHRFDPPPEVGHAPTRSFGAVFRYPTLLEHSQPGRSGGSLSLSRSAALVGFMLTRNAFAGLIPRGGWSRRFRRIRAHVPFAPPRPPRLIFVGVIRLSPEDRSETLASVPIRAKKRIGVVRRSASGLRSRLRSGSPTPSVRRVRSRRPDVRRQADPALAVGPLSGFADTIRTCNRAGSTQWIQVAESSGAVHQPPAGFTPHAHKLAAVRPIRSWALRTPPPHSS